MKAEQLRALIKSTASKAMLLTSSRHLVAKKLHYKRDVLQGGDLPMAHLKPVQVLRPIVAILYCWGDPRIP